ncbi:hypothetical protein [Streptomyces sp. NPDC093591]|uniref:hypothetical protein n=1 Tax=Streptomyces sp. NPDC093591 TaxID=3366044 RepID=UPI0037F87E78
MLVDGRMVPYTPTPVPDTGGVPAGSTFSASQAASAAPTGPFIIIDGAVRPYESATPIAPAAVPVPGSGPMVVHGVTLPSLPVAGTAGGVASGTAHSVSWPSVAITAIVAVVVVTCMLMGMSTEAIVAGIVLIVLLANHVRTALA